MNFKMTRTAMALVHNSYVVFVILLFSCGSQGLSLDHNPHARPITKSRSRTTPHVSQNTVEQRTSSKKEEISFFSDPASGLSRASFVSTCAAFCLVGSQAMLASALPTTTGGEPLHPTLLQAAAAGSRPNPSAAQESISGAIAGGALTVTKTIIKFPLDTVTVRLQMPNANQFVNSIDDIRSLFGGSYNGVTLTLLSNIPAGAVFFAVKDATKAALRDYSPLGADAPKWVTTSLAVAAAQIPYWLIRNPSEVVKVRQQARLEGYGEGVSAWSAIQATLQQGVQVSSSSGGDNITRTASNGDLGVFYTGYWENIVYAYPADVLKFIAYESITQGRKDLSPSEGALAGAMATAIAQFVTTPLDVVRNRLMTGKTKVGSSENDNNVDKKEAATGTNRATKYVQALAALARDEGLAGLFAGAAPRVGKAALSGAVQFATYEETKQKIASMIQNPKIVK
jgi:solute carrier family 25 (mitochondrial S-adenosylmethionine transporter), member 26